MDDFSSNHNTYMYLFKLPNTNHYLSDARFALQCAFRGRFQQSTFIAQSPPPTPPNPPTFRNRATCAHARILSAHQSIHIARSLITLHVCCTFARRPEYIRTLHAKLQRSRPSIKPFSRRRWRRKDATTPPYLACLRCCRRTKRRQPCVQLTLVLFGASRPAVCRRCAMAHSNAQHHSSL